MYIYRSLISPLNLYYLHLYTMHAVIFYIIYMLLYITIYVYLHYLYYLFILNV